VGTSQLTNLRQRVGRKSASAFRHARLRQTEFSSNLMTAIPQTLKSILQCPLCAQPLESTACSKCKTEFFSFGGILSFMPAGMGQKQLWQHQLAVNHQQAQAGFELMQNLLERPDSQPHRRNPARGQGELPKH
jgi:hypothetical protein